MYYQEYKCRRGNYKKISLRGCDLDFLGVKDQSFDIDWYYGLYSTSTYM